MSRESGEADQDYDEDALYLSIYLSLSLSLSLSIARSLARSLALSYSFLLSHPRLLRPVLFFPSLVYSVLSPPPHHWRSLQVTINRASNLPPCDVALRDAKFVGMVRTLPHERAGHARTHARTHKQTNKQSKRAGSAH